MASKNRTAAGAAFAGAAAAFDPERAQPVALAVALAAGEA
jgi:hypothetical protein